MGENGTEDVEVCAYPLAYLDTIGMDGRILRMPLVKGSRVWDGPPLPILSRGPSRIAVGKLTDIETSGTHRRIVARGILFGGVAEAAPFIDAARRREGCPVMLDVDVESSDMSTYIPADRHEAGELPAIMVFHRWRLRAVTVCVDGEMPVWEGCTLRTMLNLQPLREDEL